MPPRPEIKLSEKQHKALFSDADITIFGGGNGGGKSFTLRALPLLPQYLKTPGCRTVLFAETNTKLEQANGMVDACKEMYAPLHPDGLKGFKQTPKKRWTFPTKDRDRPATIDLSFVGEPGQWDGMEAAVIGIDQVEQITWKQFDSVTGRNRSTLAVRPRVFCTANPPEDGREHWLTKLLTAGGWIGVDGYPLPEMDGKVRWYAVVDDEFIFADTPEELAAQGVLVKDRSGEDIPPKSLSFVQALVDDHPDAAFAAAYKRELAQKGEAERARRLRGNWYVVEEAGKYFQATMFPDVDYDPSRHARGVRSWDQAWSTSEKADMTPGVLEYMEPDGLFTIFDTICFRGTFHHVEMAVEWVAEVDGRDVIIRLPKDAGAAGGLQSGLAQRLGAKGYIVVLTADRGDKLTRSKPYQACCERRQVRLAKSHTTAKVAQRLTQPFEIHNKDGQIVRIEGLDVSNVVTLNGWKHVFVEHHVKFGRSTLAKKHIKKDCVDAAVGGYEVLVSEPDTSPRAPTSNEAQTMESMQQVVGDLFGRQNRGLKI